MHRRALWLVDDPTLRQFEVPMLRSLGYEIFLPKSPSDARQRLSALKQSCEASLTIPKDLVGRLNRHDFQGEMPAEIVDIVNSHFDLAIFDFDPEQMRALVRSFRGVLVLRATGLPEGTYTDLATAKLGPGFLSRLRAIETRFLFGQAHPHLAAVEKGVFQRQATTLPIGLTPPGSSGHWTGEERRLLFICPSINASSYHRGIYESFRADFGDLPHIIAGLQHGAVVDTNVADDQTGEGVEQLMRRSSVMFYQGREERYLPTYTLQAIQLGVPLVFMAGGMLDRLGGIWSPGRSTSVGEARRKIERLLAGDPGFAAELQTKQGRLLSPFAEEPVRAAWRAGLQRFADARSTSAEVAPVRPKKVAILMSAAYSGGTLRGGKLVARAIDLGARAAGDHIDVVFGYPEGNNAGDPLEDLPASVATRPFRWKTLTEAETRRACVYAGIEGAAMLEPHQAPDDGMAQFLDCDLWVLISDRLQLPLLPIRPHIIVVYDYLQRYTLALDDSRSRALIGRAHAAEAVLVTTNFTARDAQTYAGIARHKIRKVPLLAPDFSSDRRERRERTSTPDYFVWTTNPAAHKNHVNALKALQLYYGGYGGSLHCHVTGVRSMTLLQDAAEGGHVRELMQSSPELERNINWRGEMNDPAYRDCLRGAAFLWHPARIDNGTFAAVEAAQYGVPTLSSDYPPMREIDQQFGLNLSWMDPADPVDMAKQLFAMEIGLAERRSRVPSKKRLATQSVERLAGEFWATVREFL